MTIDTETCDRCGPYVRASVVVSYIPVPVYDTATKIQVGVMPGELTLCGHCFDVHEIAIEAAGYMVTDYRLICGGIAA